MATSNQLDQSLVTPPVVIKKCYIFKGWWTVKDVNF